jgi:hypothetical protein
VVGDLYPPLIGVTLAPAPPFEKGDFGLAITEVARSFLQNS